MRLVITKTCRGVIDTQYERERIKKAFRRDPETRKRLTALMDAIEALDWPKAMKLLKDKWWRGRDERMECPRVEFVGLLHVQNPVKHGHPAFGFDQWASYLDLVCIMARKRLPGGAQLEIWAQSDESVRAENLSKALDKNARRAAGEK